MRTFKNVAIFMTGGLVTLTLLAKDLFKSSRFPREGTVEYEDDRIRVVRATVETPKEGDLKVATILYKKHSE